MPQRWVPATFVRGGTSKGLFFHARDLPVAVLNPRRDEWDASWEQSISNPLFRGQVDAFWSTIPRAG